MKLKTEKQRNSMKPKASYLKRLIILIYLQPKWSREKKSTQITNIKNDRGDITTDATDIKESYSLTRNR